MTGPRSHARSRRGARRPAASIELRELTIKAIGAKGDGLADGLFAPFTLPGERVLARVEGERASLAEVLAASPDRVAAPCPHFGECGGCALQHWAMAPYLAWKQEIIRQALASVRLETEILPPFQAPPGSRRRLALHARRIEGRVIVGLKSRRSWIVTPIEHCHIADPRLVSALPALAAIAEPLLEHPKSAPTLHVTATLTGLDIDITGVEQRSGGPSADARLQVAESAARADVARVSLAGEVIYQARNPEVRMGGALVALPPGAFLQAVPAAEAAMVGIALEAAAGARRIADLYCGVGAFTIPLAGLAPVLAADLSRPAIEALTRAVGGAPGVKSIIASARDLDRRPLLAEELAGLDLVVIDPPRAGAAAQHGEIARSTCAKVVSVSCNPTTFARDARILADGGFTLERVLPVDQFLWSPHIELVGLFSQGSL